MGIRQGRSPMGAIRLSDIETEGRSVSRGRGRYGSVLWLGSVIVALTNGMWTLHHASMRGCDQPTLCTDYFLDALPRGRSDTTLLHQPSFSPSACKMICACGSLAPILHAPAPL